MVARHHSLKGMPASDQQALVRSVLDGNDGAIEKFWHCTIRLLTSIARRSPVYRDYSAYKVEEIVDSTFAYLICGLRPTGGIKPANDTESPLSRWLQSLDTAQCPLEKYVQTIARQFMRDLLQNWLREDKKKKHYRDQTYERRYKKTRSYTELDSDTNDHAFSDKHRLNNERSIAGWSPLNDSCSPVEESVMTSRLAEGWIRRLTEQDQAIIGLTAPMYEGLSQKDAAKSLGISDATMCRRIRELRSNFDAYLDDE